MAKLVFWFMLFLCLFIGGGAFSYRFFETIDPYVKPYFKQTEILNVPVMPERSAIACLGRVEPKDEVLAIGAQAGSRIDALLVKEGEFVETGQVLAYLVDFERSQTEVQYVQSQLEEAKNTLIAEKLYAQRLVQEAEIQAKTTLKAQDILIENQQIQMALAKIELDFNQQEYNRINKTQEALTIQQKDQQHYLYRKSQEQVNLARGTLTLLKDQRETQLLLVQSKLEIARANLARVLSATPVASLEKRLQLSERQRDLLIVKAPRAGQILKIGVLPGETVTTAPILQMGNTRHMYVAAEVYETDAMLLKVGQTAEIESRALPRKVSGVVERVGWIIAKNDILDIDPAARTDARVIEVKIRLAADPDVARMTHLQVKVKINLAVTHSSTQLPE